MLKSENKKDIF